MPLQRSHQTSSGIVCLPNGSLRAAPGMSASVRSVALELAIQPECVAFASIFNAITAVFLRGRHKRNTFLAAKVAAGNDVNRPHPLMWKGPIFNKTDYFIEAYFQV